MIRNGDLGMTKLYITGEQKRLYITGEQKKSHGAWDFNTDSKTSNITDCKMKNHFSQSGQNFLQFQF